MIIMTWQVVIDKILSPLDATKDGKIDVDDLEAAAEMFLLFLFDVNKDGVVDVEDWNDFKSHLEHSLDINNDGKVDIKDAKVFLKIIGVIATLTASPLSADAKGGSGGSRSSRSHSGRRSYSGSSATHNPRQYIRKWWRKSGFSLNPNACLDIPLQGEEIELYSAKLDKYIPAIASDINDSSCRFTAVPKDTGVMAAKEISASRVSTLYFPAVILAAVSFLQSNSPFDKQIAEFRDTPRNTHLIQPPRSGMYRGKSEEFSSYSGKNVSQGVETVLEFDDDGTIKGSGVDSIDGTYSV